MNEDRRIERTRELLQQAFLEMLRTHDYDALTIQAIADHANVGRTTFYLHYNSKEDLYRHTHQAEVERIGGPPLTLAELFDDKPPTRMTAVYAYHWATRDLLRMVYFGKDTDVIHRQMRDHSTYQTTEHLRRVFQNGAFTVPVEVVASFLVVSEIGLMMWWIEKHPPYTPEQMAAYFHRLRRGVLRDSLVLSPNSD